MSTTPREVTPLRWPGDATLRMPGSKSEANRLLVAAALSGRTVTVHGATPSDDVRHLVSGLATLGFAATFVDEANGVVRVGPRAAGAATRGELFCGNAGTALRFLVSVAAITPGEWTLTGDAAMQRRPIDPLVQAWRQLGVDLDATNGLPPVHVRCTAVPIGGRVHLDASASSQFASSLLLVGAHLRDGLEITFDGAVASLPYLQLTRAVLQKTGIALRLTARGAGVRGPALGSPTSVEVTGDWSSAGVWTCLNHLTGSRITATNLRAGSGQPDEQLASVLGRVPRTGDHTIDVGPLPDQFCNLAVVAAHRSGTTRLVGGANLRIKECDRIAVMARGLLQLGVRLEERPDGLVVHGGREARAAAIDPANDHRIAIAFALAGLLAPGVTIVDPTCVSKSYPAFWADLERVQRSLRCVAVVGMRGAGKSTFAAALAQATGLPHVDIDRLFEARFQPIAPFVAKYGWHNFRDMEAALVDEALQPGHIVATGGGAIEHPETQARLRERALVVWLDADAATLRAHIAADPRQRPSVTGAPVDQEIDVLLARRRPLFERFATCRIDATAATADQVGEALRLLRDSGR
ncbi:MAG: 3-phosphoshikimate 1-carboxyvinyltransferase [Planctomycetes bacterium]|nr:3-phosphoshikimate 1-carboxyvinyltransferase [Planctomycetota bacterium]